MKTKKKSISAVSDRIGKALSDSRKKIREGPPLQVAVWCLLNRGKKLSPDLIDCEIIRLLRDSDSAFFREVAEAMAQLESEKAFIENDAVISKVPADARVMIAWLWNKWERDREKIEVRLAELKQMGFTVTNQTYHQIVKRDGLKKS